MLSFPAVYVHYHASVDQDGWEMFATFQTSRLRRVMAKCKMKPLVICGTTENICTCTTQNQDTGAM